MSIPVEAYTVAGVVRGTVPGTGVLRDHLEHEPLLEIRDASFAPLTRVDEPSPHGVVLLQPDDILVTLDPAGSALVHAQWHDIRVLLGPWVVEGELPTMPGFDPGRALARPSGSFVQLRNARVVRAADDAIAADHHTVLVNRYAVERVTADLELGFYFPGAAVAEAARVASGV